jgi:hypothetical protein
MRNLPMRNDASRAGEVRSPRVVGELERFGARRRCERCLICGGACICIATFLPWIMARYETGWWSSTGMQLTYAHFPPVTIGYLSLVLGSACVLAGRADAARAGHAELGMIPAGIAAFFLWFVNSSLHGHLGEQLEAIKGFQGAWLGLGYWLMMIGTALALVGSVGAAGFVRSDGSLYLDPVEAKPSSNDVAGREQLTGSGRGPMDHSSTS